MQQTLQQFQKEVYSSGRLTHCSLPTNPLEHTILHVIQFDYIKIVAAAKSTATQSLGGNDHKSINAPPANIYTN